MHGEWERCARLYGAAEAEAARTGLRRDATDEAFIAARVDAARRALGKGKFSGAENEGRALPYEEALGSARAWVSAMATS